MGENLSNILYSGSVEDHLFFGKINGTHNGISSKNKHYFPYKVLAPPIQGRGRSSTILRVMKYNIDLEEIGEIKIVLSKHLKDKKYSKSKRKIREKYNKFKK